MKANYIVEFALIVLAYSDQMSYLLASVYLISSFKTAADYGITQLMEK